MSLEDVIASLKSTASLEKAEDPAEFNRVVETSMSEAVGFWKGKSLKEVSDYM